MNAKEYVLSKVSDATLKRDDDGKYYVTSEKLDMILGSWITEDIAWERAKSRVENMVFLPCGVAIRDDRHLGLGLSVLSSGVKRWARLCKTKKDGKFIFYVSVTGTWLETDEVDDYITQLQFIKQACIEANEYFNGGGL